MAFVRQETEQVTLGNSTPLISQRCSKIRRPHTCTCIPVAVIGHYLNLHKVQIQLRGVQFPVCDSSTAVRETTHHARFGVPMTVLDESL
jgi:hypothetical protein